MKTTELKAIQLAELFSALSDASRVRLISLLIEGEMSVSALAEGLTMTESGCGKCTWSAPARQVGRCSTHWMMTTSRTSSGSDWITSNMVEFIERTTYTHASAQ